MHKLRHDMAKNQHCGATEQALGLRIHIQLAVDVWLILTRSPTISSTFFLL